MKYPKINKQSRREVSIPQLSGGLNLRDSLTGIKDNQMTECVNMWYKNGMLKTRPPFVTDDHRITWYDKDENIIKTSTRFHGEIKVVYRGYNCILASNEHIYNDDNGLKTRKISFEFQAVDRIFTMPQISGISGDDITYFCVEMGGVLYCYISDFSIWSLEYRKYAENEDELRWENVSMEERYTPTVYVHCRRSGWDDFEGTFFEGYNLISNRYKMIYSAYNEEDSDKSHPMRYALGNELPETGEISVEITSYDVESESTITVEHIINYTKEQYDDFKNGDILIENLNENGASKDGLYLFVKYNYVGFLFEPEFSYQNGVANINSEELIKKYACSEDNVVITAPYDVSESEKKKVFCMTRSTWFGGVSNGITGGSRLFLCGNTDDNEKSLVLWSGLNDPLYFGENCNAYVGSKSMAVTAFGKQGENLIVFKENKIYASSYNRNTNIDADNLINQSIVDYEANSVYFPFILINGFIGCDCPDTIQMCRNRLVWATSEGKVYTLCTMNQYNEHTVYELSDMVMPRLKQYKENFKIATSADFDGHYVLFLGGCAFVMNYCCYGYQYVYSYSKSDDANTLIPWYFWDFSFLNEKNDCCVYDCACVNVLDGVLIMRANFENLEKDIKALVGFSMYEMECSNADNVFYYDEINKNLGLKNSVINSKITTKLFEFGDGIYNVTVDKVVVKLGANDISNVVVGFITEQGNETMNIVDNRVFNGIKTADFIKSKRLYPSFKNIVNFGLELECDGRLCVDGISMQYRVLGGVK